MPRRISRHISFANVMSVIAVFIALGGTAFAFTLGKNSVGARQIKPNAVSTSELKRNSVSAAKVKGAAVTSSKIAGNAVTGAAVADGSLGAADIDQASLKGVSAGNITSVSAKGDGSCTLQKPVAGVTAAQTLTGLCDFTFATDVSACDAVASVDLRLTPNQVIGLNERTAHTLRNATNPHVIETQTFLDNPSPTASNLPVTLVVVC